MKIFAANESSVTLRSPERITQLFEGFELVEPGLVPIFDWRPEDPHEFDEWRDQIPFYGAVGRKL